MVVRVGTIAGSAIGWGGALAMMVLSLTNVLDDMTAQTLMLIALSMAIVCSGFLAMERNQRPLGAAYEIGYNMGRRDAIRDANGRTNVSPIRRVSRGLSEFSRDAVGR